MKPFKVHSPYTPTGDQPQAIEALSKGIQDDMENQILLGVTGSGKTYTMANVIEQVQKPTLVISHNKTLAAQLYQEFRDFFPENHVEYFVSYYDYYQPEAYVPQRDLYIEKEADINDEIDKLRLSATTSLLTHTDTIVVASVSCIYNLGSPIEYAKSIVQVKEGMTVALHDIATLLHNLHYERSEYDFKRSTYRIRGDTLDIYLAYDDIGIRIEFLDRRVVSIKQFDPLTGDVQEKLTSTAIYPAKHYLTADERQQDAIAQIQTDLTAHLKTLKKEGKALEAYRLEQRTNYDLELITELGYCNGIENYSRYFDGRKPGEPPYTLLDFFHNNNDGDFLTIIDESHITVPQIRGMYTGDQARKKTLIDYGFRLPSAIDNRPLQFDEFLARIPQITFVSATPGDWEIERTQKEVKKKRRAQKDIPHTGIVEQMIRPTGILDPSIEVRPSDGQIPDLVREIEERIARGERVLVTTLTKRMAEDLSQYLEEREIRGAYLHSDIETLERVDILEDLRRGEYDVVVGINLLREGLDLPEVSLVAILDADKEGFLRSETSLVQTMGRAARHIDGTVIMYADTTTGSMQRAMDEVTRRRALQEEHNKKEGITPHSITKEIRERVSQQVDELEEEIEEGLLSDDDIVQMLPREKKKKAQELTRSMKLAAKELRFEDAATLRDEIKKLK